MEQPEGEIKTFNADKQIAEQRDLPLVLKLFSAFNQARTGETPSKKLDELSDNDIVLNQIQGLTKVIYALRDLIVLGRTKIQQNSFNKWKLYNNSNPEDKKIPFEKHENDYNTLEMLREKLKACHKDIIEADRTKKVDDDFKIIRQTDKGDVWELTDNYNEMIDELEDTWRDIENLLHHNKVLSQGMVEDEILNHEQLSQEAKRRFIES